MTIPLALLDTDTLSEVIKRRDPSIQRKASDYLSEHEHFRFSILTRYEILRGLKVKSAQRQIAFFEHQCEQNDVLPLTEPVVTHAADLYAHLYKQGKIISDADILIAATALVHQLILITGNTAHFSRIPDLQVQSWHSH